MKTIASACFALLTLLALPGCMSPQEDMARFIAPHAEEEPAYREKAAEFIHYAQAGDLEHMEAISSHASHASQKSSMRSLYKDQVISAFQETTVDWKPNSKPDKDETGNMGFLFTGTAYGSTSFDFDVVVMKEEGKLVVINIRRHRWYDHL